MKALFQHLKAIARKGSALRAIAPSSRWLSCQVFEVDRLSAGHREFAVAHVLNKTNKKVVRLLTFKTTLATVLFALPQVPIVGNFSGGKALAQQSGSCPAGTTAQTLQWTPTSNLAGIVSQNLSINGISATLSFTESTPGEVLDPNQTLITNETYGGLPGPNLRFNIGVGRSEDPNSRFDRPAPVGSSATLTINFSQPVTLASPLTLLDVDRSGARDTIGDIAYIYQDRVTVTAFNGNAPVGVTLTAISPSNVRVTGNVAEGIVENAFPTESFGNVTATPSGAVTRIQILYQPGTEFGNPLQDETIGLDRIQICVPTGTGTIGDTVYNDTNGNGVQDAGEPGISGRTISLTGAGPDGQFGTADDITSTATTDNNGRYSIPNLPAGNYRVAVTNPPDGLSPTQTPPTTITLAAGQNLDTADFGFAQPGTIGDTVYNDTNGNGVQDPGEPGISGRTISLTGAGPDGQFGTADDITRTATTDNNGRYSIPNLPAGNYRVAVTNPPDGLSPSQTPPATITLAAGQNLDTADFGFAQPGTIGDTVYNDTNGNGVQDAGEPGISGSTISLTGAGPDGQFGTADDITRTATTDNNGRYSIPNLPAGSYRVSVTNPPNGLSPSQTPPATITLAAGQNLDTADFGFTQQQLGTIGNTVFNDRNSNNVQDPGEPGLPNITVTLTGAGPDGQFGTGDDITRTATTDNNGRYSIPNLPAGTYRVAVTNPPANFTPTLTQPNPITLAGGQNINTANFGFNVPAVGAGETNLLLVKRITNVLRNGQSIPGTNFTTFDDGPGNDDNQINQSQPVRGVRDLQTPVQSGDEVEYTIYFLAQGVNNVRFCDLIPDGTSYSNNGISVSGAGNGADQGTFLSPLAPLPAGNTCQNQTNNKGAVIVNLGTFNISSGNPAFVRFRVRVD
ncbi:MSCRAMM family protein [Scytonema sp. PRP1]|uniref:MSCRAMM family protein n=1 Tax=Scytonema sp. PRP1 TaxID=3120513 RepID=UPI002FD5F429